MDAEHLQDRVSRGLNVAARSIGAPFDAFRAAGVIDPVSTQGRFLRLNAAFTGTDGRFHHASAYGTALWYGIFDTTCTRAGDYLVGAAGIWFIAAQQPLLPVLCVQTNRTVTFSRPAAQAAAGVNTYGGVTAENLEPILERWPASILTGAKAGRTDAGLPNDVSAPYWTVLLPAFPNAMLRVADLMTDDIGRNAVISAAELSDLGWRLTVKQATT